MAKKNKQAHQRRNDSESDPESDAENENREYERGRTVLALVGKAIDSNTKIPLQWNCRNVPFGDHKTSFSTYIGVVARERVSINYRKWPDVPQAKLDEVYEFIAKGFIVREDRRKWILTRASKRWNAFKTRLRKYWLYKSDGEIRKKRPWKYRWIHQPVWDKFTATYTTPEFRAISAKFREKSQLKNSSYRGGRRGYQYFEEQVEQELLKKKIHFTEVPRHLVWIKAHSDVNDDGHIIFNNPTDLKVGEEIRTLMAQSQDGGIGSSGRDDILARALKKPERGGQVVAVGSGITNKEYFGYNKPIPPSHLHTQINNLTSELVAVKNQHNLLASFVLSNLNEEQLRRFPAITTDANGQLDASGQFGSFGQPGLNDTRSIPFIGHVGNQATSFNVQTTGANGQFDASGQFGFFCQPGLTGTRSNPFIGHVGNQANGFDVQTTGANGQIDASVLDEGVSFTQLLTASFGLRQGCKDDRVSRPNHQERLLVEETKPYRVETEPYRVPWPENGPELQHNPHNNFQLQSSRNRSIFLEGENDCCLAIEGDQGHQIVANGTVFIESAEKVTVHCHNLSAGFRRVSIIEAIMPCAPLPCPTEEFTVVVQAIHSFVKWPSHLIFPRNMDDDETAKANLQPKNQFTTTSPRSCSSQGSCSRKYIITDKDRAKLTTDLLRVLKNEAMVMKKNDEKIIVPIPTSVCYFSIDVELNYEDLFDWCFQREIGANHISIFMKYLSDKCHKESVSGMYGFCDVNYLSPLSLLEKGERIDYLARVFGWNEGLNINQTFFAPFHENRHWMLAVISPWNGIVWWLNPSGSENEISQFAEEIINEGIIKFSLEHRKDIKKLKRKPLIKWRKPLCPRQPVDSLDCGFYVCRYMLEAIANRHQVIPDQYFKDVPKTYEQQMIDEVRDMWTTFVLKHKEVEDEEDGLEVS